jgi:F-type H+-transporting ATPase subunit gamma
VHHLEGAVRSLDDSSAELRRKCNALHQQEIIEEIEVILLNTSTFGHDSRERR